MNSYQETILWIGLGLVLIILLTSNTLHNTLFKGGNTGSSTSMSNSAAKQASKGSSTTPQTPFGTGPGSEITVGPNQVTVPFGGFPLPLGVSKVTPSNPPSGVTLT